MVAAASCYLCQLLVGSHSSAGSGVDPADIQMLEQIINETEQQQQDKASKYV